MKLSQVRAETRDIVVEFDSDVLNVTYRPNTFTVDAASEIQAAMSDPAKQTEGLFKMVSEMLAGWDLEDDNGEIVPLGDPARMKAEVPMPIFGKIFEAMRKDQDPSGEGRRS